MQKRFLKLCFLLVIFFVLPSFVWAAPSDIVVSEMIAHDSVVTINGTGFGIKSPVAPYFFDNFESGTLGSNIAGNNGTIGSKTWVNTDVLPGGTYRNDQYYGQGSKSAGMGPKSGNNFATVGINGLDSTTAYYSVRWRWLAPNFNSASGTVFKPIRIAGTPGYYTTKPVMYLQGQASGWFYMSIANSAGTEISNVSTTQPSQSQWHRDEAYFKLGGNSDGSGKYWLDGQLLYNVSGLTTGTSNTIGSFLLPFQIAQNSTQFDFTGWADDVYFDNTQARVEICDANKKNASTVCEIQIPQNIWTDNGQSGGAQLEIKVNQGSFANGDPAFLYVIDANGDTNAVGFPVTFRSIGGDTTAPSAPTGLSIE